MSKETYFVDHAGGVNIKLSSIPFNLLNINSLLLSNNINPWGSDFKEFGMANNSLKHSIKQYDYIYKSHDIMIHDGLIDIFIVGDCSQLRACMQWNINYNHDDKESRDRYCESLEDFNNQILNYNGDQSDHSKHFTPSVRLYLEGKKPIVGILDEINVVELSSKRPNLKFSNFMKKQNYTEEEIASNIKNIMITIDTTRTYSMNSLYKVNDFNETGVSFMINMDHISRTEVTETLAISDVKKQNWVLNDDQDLVLPDKNGEYLDLRDMKSQGVDTFVNNGRIIIKHYGSEDNVYGKKIITDAIAMDEVMGKNSRLLKIGDGRYHLERESKIMVKSNVDLVSREDLITYNFDTFLAETTYYISNGKYTIRDIPERYAFALKNNGMQDKISFTPNNDKPIVINVNGGSLSSDSLGDYYQFTTTEKIHIASADFKFMRGKVYEFQAGANFNASHPFCVYPFTSEVLNNPGDKFEITIPLDQSITRSNRFYYQCKIHSVMNGFITLYENIGDDGFIYDYYYGDVDIMVNEGFSDFIPFLSYKYKVHEKNGLLHYTLPTIVRIMNGEIKYNDLEGGFHFITDYDDSEKNYVPLVWESEFMDLKRDGILVQATLEIIDPPPITIFQFGIPVRIKDLVVIAKPDPEPVDPQEEPFVPRIECLTEDGNVNIVNENDGSKKLVFNNGNIYNSKVWII